MTQRNATGIEYAHYTYNYSRGPQAQPRRTVHTMVLYTFCLAFYSCAGLATIRVRLEYGLQL